MTSFSCPVKINKLIILSVALVWLSCTFDKFISAFIQCTQSCGIMPIDFEEYESQKRRSLRVPISSTAAYVLIQWEVGTGVFKFVTCRKEFSFKNSA